MNTMHYKNCITLSINGHCVVVGVKNDGYEGLGVEIQTL
jgi:hypothetical protein